MTKELRSHNDAWNNAWLAKDAATVERMAADDYVYFGPAGQILRRSSLLRIIRSPSYRLAKGRWTGHRHTTIWVRRNRRWQVRLEHCSAIAPQ